MSLLTNVNSTSRVVPKIEPFVKTGLMGMSGIKNFKDIDKVCPILWCKEDVSILQQLLTILEKNSIYVVIPIFDKKLKIYKVNFFFY
jgi:hypothetical protein